MMIRAATPEDADAIAAIHVAGWREAYPGLLPDEVLAGLSVEKRAERWRSMLGTGAAVWLAPGAGFSVLGEQRDEGLAAEWPDELHTLYVLRAHQCRGLGRALLRAALGEAPRPFSAFVLEGSSARPNRAASDRRYRPRLARTRDGLTRGCQPRRGSSGGASRTAQVSSCCGGGRSSSRTTL